MWKFEWKNVEIWVEIFGQHRGNLGGHFWSAKRKFGWKFLVSIEEIWVEIFGQHRGNWVEIFGQHRGNFG